MESGIRFSDSRSVQDFYKKPTSRKPNPPVFPVGIPAPQAVEVRHLQAEKPVKGCPESLSRFITNAFLKCQSEDERRFIESALKTVIEEARRRGLYSEQNWDVVPLPLLPREQALLSRQITPKVAVEAQPQRRKTKFSEANSREVFHIPNKVRRTTELSAPESKSLAKDEARTWAKDEAKSTAKNESRHIKKGKYAAELKFADREAKYCKPEAKRAEPKDSAIKTDSKKHDKVVGTCTTLEKQYLRLTDEVDPTKVRPESVLKQALAHFKLLWRKQQINYEYFSEQLRSIRQVTLTQDMTVQGVVNEFTVEVYQTHCRLALEASDIDQFTSCLGRLNELFMQGLNGNRSVSSIDRSS